MGNERRNFLRWAVGGLFGATALFFFSMVKSALYRLKIEAGPRYLPVDLPPGISFHREVIVNRINDEYLVMSARCTHLGCIVDRKKGNELICPCHGSKYSLEGKVLSGPAKRDLARLAFHIDSKEKKIVIESPT